MSNTDCEAITGKPICKETVAGGAKSCQAASTCTHPCASGEFCDAANICQYGNLNIYKVIVMLYNFSVLCCFF